MARAPLLNEGGVHKQKVVLPGEVDIKVDGVVVGVEEPFANKLGNK